MGFAHPWAGGPLHPVLRQRCGTSSLLEGVRRNYLARSSTGRATGTRRPAATRPVGEGFLSASQKPAVVARRESGAIRRCWREIDFLGDPSGSRTRVPDVRGGGKGVRARPNLRNRRVLFPPAYPSSALVQARGCQIGCQNLAQEHIRLSISRTGGSNPSLSATQSVAFTYNWR